GRGRAGERRDRRAAKERERERMPDHARRALRVAGAAGLRHEADGRRAHAEPRGAGEAGDAPGEQQQPVTLGAERGQKKRGRDEHAGGVRDVLRDAPAEGLGVRRVARRAHAAAPSDAVSARYALSRWKRRWKLSIARSRICWRSLSCIANQRDSTPAKPSASSGPVSAAPSAAISRQICTRSEISTGVPQAIASTTAKPKFSVCDESTNASAARSAPHLSSARS